MVQLAVYNAFLIYKTIASGLPAKKSCHEFSESHGNIFCSIFFYFRWKGTNRNRKKKCIGKRTANRMNQKK